MVTPSLSSVTRQVSMLRWRFGDPASFTPEG